MAPDVWDDMGEDWLTQAFENRWALAFVAYFLGFLTHWGVNRQAKSGPGEPPKAAHTAPGTAAAAASKPAPSGNGTDPAALSDVQLAAIEAEIRQAKSFLQSEQRQHRALDEQLSALDAAIKRANGRLKLALRCINKNQNAH